jgi:hypothetical protein
MNLSRLAEETAKKDFKSIVEQSSPSVFYLLSERKGSKLTINHGTLGAHFNGLYSEGCVLEQSGPIAGEHFIRAAAFRPSTQSCVDLKYHSKIVPSSSHQSFSVEAFFRCVGGSDSSRTVLCSGRYQIGVNRENFIYVSLYEHVHSITLSLAPCERNTWMHIAISFNGSVLRCFLNSELVKELDVSPIFIQKQVDFENEYSENIQKLKLEEEKEIVALKDKTAREANTYFQSKEGTTYLKRTSQIILDTEDLDDIVVPTDGNRFNLMKDRKAVALKRAKDQYIQETYDENSRTTADKYKQLLSDFEDQHQRRLNDAQLDSFRPLRIGASHPNSNARYGDNYFYGDISCVSVYDFAIHPDLVRSHYTRSKRNPRTDARRLFFQAISVFQEAIMNFTFNSGIYSTYLPQYVDCLIYLLKSQTQERDENETRQVLAELLKLTAYFKEKSRLDPLVSLLNSIPRDPAYSDLIVEIVLALKSSDKYFLSKSPLTDRKVLAFLPFETGLIAPNRSRAYYDAAAYIFQEVVRDINFSFIYGDVDLKWLTELTHSKLIISLVQCAYDNKQLKVLELTNLFDEIQMESDTGVAIIDHDIQVGRTSAL